MVFNQYNVFALKIISAILHLRQSYIKITLHIETYFNGAGIHLRGQLNFPHLHIFASLLIMDINKCQGMMKFSYSNLFLLFIESDSL